VNKRTKENCIPLAPMLDFSTMRDLRFTTIF